MPRYGPLRDARNPLQRAFVRWKLAAPAFFGFGMSGFVVFLFAFPAAGGQLSWLAVVVIGLVTFILCTAIMFFAEGNHRTTREQRAARWTLYMPWFALKATDALADPDAHAQYVAARSQPRKGTVALGEARNPLQRLAIDHVTIAYTIGGMVAGACIAAPMWSRSILTGFVITAAGAVAGLVFSLRSDLRRMTSGERATVHVTNLWPRRRGVDRGGSDQPTSHAQ